MAARVGISKAMLSKIENAQISCSLCRGSDVERPSSYVRAGGGARIVRHGTQEGHVYQLLGTLRGKHRRLECLHVTLERQSPTYPVFQHPGTEFVYMLEGVMDYGHSRS